MAGKGQKDALNTHSCRKHIGETGDYKINAGRKANQ